MRAEWQEYNKYMLKKYRTIVITVLVVIVAPVAYWLISPLFIDVRVEERLEDIMKPQEAISFTQEKAGTFSGLLGHNAEGSAKLLKIGEKYYVRFEDDFKMTNGPDLFVHLGKDGEYAAEARLAPLKGNMGGQNYEVPTGINPSDYNEVWIWCRSFAVPFGKAVLQ